MWRKIHSNRDPKDTLFSELKKEFNPWFTAFKSYLTSAATGYPKFSFYTMILLLMLSAALSFTVFRNNDQDITPPLTSKPNVMKDGFSRIIQATGQLRETLALKNIVDSLAAKKQLSAGDSILLDSALSRLQQIHQP